MIPPFLRIEVVDGPDRSRVAAAYQEMIDGQLGGVVLRAAVDRVMLEAAATRIANTVVPEHLQHAPVVSSLAEPAMGVVGRCMRLSTVDDYPPCVAATRALFCDLFDDAEGLERVAAQLILSISGKVPVASPGEPGSFAPALISRVRAGAEIPYHFDNFIFLEDNGFELVKPWIDRRTLINFQIPIQRPIGGGNLVLSSYCWDDFLEEGPPRPNAHIDTQARGAAHHLEVDLEVGDFLLFDAGRICHRITPIEGARERITYVGHTALRADGAGVAYFT